MFGAEVIAGVEGDRKGDPSEQLGATQQRPMERARGLEIPLGALQHVVSLGSDEVEASVTVDESSTHLLVAYGGCHDEEDLPVRVVGPD